MVDLDALCRWFEEEKRELPWRESPTFYSVWVSEVMLQQTQASVAKPYFERWMQRFPTIEALASAEEEEVIKLWEGLGYYSRARNLHAGAKMLSEIDLNQFLKDDTLLLKIKGLGPYTRGAIRSFAFKQRAAAVDGNVTRVIARHFLIEEVVEKGQTKRTIEEIVTSLLPVKAPWVVMEALIELGALVCQKVPKCGQCPLKDECLGYQSGEAAFLPNKKKRAAITLLTRSVAVLQWNEFFLVKKTEPGKVMAGLYEFPYFEKGDADAHFEELGIKATLIERLPIVKQAFTRYRVTLLPALYRVEKKGNPLEYEWVSKKEISKFPFSSGHKKILEGKHAHFTH